MIAAWSKRHDSMKSARVEWTTRRFRGADLVEMMAEGGGTQGPPVQNTTLVQNYRLLFDGSKMRYEIDKKKWSEAQRRYVDVPYLSAFDGDSGKSLWPNPGDSIHPLGMIDAHSPDISSVSLAPIMLACRPLGYGAGTFDFASHQLEQNWTIERVSARSAIKLRRQTDQLLCEAWFDNSPDFRLVEFVTSSQGRVLSRCKLEYLSQDHRCIPSAWELESLGKQGQLLERDEASVTRIALNPDFALDAFEIEFPVGCYVDDRISKKRYVVQSPNNLREVSRSERRLDHDTLMSTKTGGSSARPRLLYYTIATVLVLLFGLVGLRLWGRRVFPLLSR
jgi:hypothetical protein